METLKNEKKALRISSQFFYLSLMVTRKIFKLI